MVLFERRIAGMVSETATPRILISRMGSIRETILSLPIANALREKFPNAYIGWVVEKKAAAVVAKHRAIDATIELSPGWVASPKLVSEARRELRSHHFDISIDCEGVTKSALTGWLAKAKQRIGFRGRHGRELSSALNNMFVQPVFTHLTDRSLELLIPLEIHSPKVHWNFPLSEAARTWAVRWRRTIPQTRLAIIHPGAGWKSKLWECNRYAATARYISDRFGYRSVISWGNEVERQMAQTIVFQCKGVATLAPDTDLQHLAALTERADLFLGPDSAPLHMAVAVSTPAIGLYGATIAGISGPYGQVAIAEAFEGGSRRHRRKADNSAMRRIEVDQVCKVIQDIESKRQYRKVA
jgi:ADP-heptose:LPS heptosyltransferase